MIHLDLTLPAMLAPLYEPRRYKVMHGGRGGGKSHGVAQVLLDLGARQPLRILCAREVQKSMRDSVHRLLRDYIVKLGLESFYEVLDTEIRGANGTLILFSGLQSHTVDSIKSFEGVNIVWVEEAHGVSKKSWDVLIPTIRAESSEIWMTLNPDMDTDETYRRFIATPSPDTWVCEINWRDNPWFPEVLNQERLKAKRSMLAEDYEHIWEGKPRTVAEGAIYRHEIQALYAENRVARVPYDPTLPVHTVWDLGWNDAMTIGFVQRGPVDVRIIDYIEDSHRTLDWYVAQIEKRPYRWGYDYLPHDGRTRNFQTGKSTEDLMREMGRKPIVLAQTSVEEGIKAARMLFPRCYFDQDKTARLLECLKRYRRALHAQTGEPMGPLHDEFSHGCLVAGTLIETKRGMVPIELVQAGDEVLTPVGYARVLNAGPTKVADQLIEVTTEDGAVLVATPEHKIFTTRGVVLADTLRCGDSVHTYRSAPCLSYHLIKSAGYRDAVIASFKASGIGSGRRAEFTATKSAAGRAFSILKSIGRYMASQLADSSPGQLTGTLRTQTLQIGPRLAPSGQDCTMFKRWTECGTTKSRPATSSPITSLAGCSCTASSGSAQTGRSLMGIMSITGITTVATIAWKTLSCCLRLRIRSIMRRAMNGLEVEKMLNNCAQPELLPRNGTKATPDEHGTVKTPNALGKSANGSQLNAGSAESLSRPHTQQEQSSATRIAGLRRFVSDGETVYDLTVEKHHCYLANGLLVSNSDMFRYIGQAVPVMPASMEQNYEEPPPPDWRT